MPHTEGATLTNCRRQVNAPLLREVHAAEEGLEVEVGRIIAVCVFPAIRSPSVLLQQSVQASFAGPRFPFL